MLHSDVIHSVFEKKMWRDLASDLVCLVYKNTIVFEDGIIVCCPKLDKWCFDWNLHSKHYLYSPDFDSTFISCQQTTLIHTEKLHHQSKCSAVKGLLTLFSKTIHSSQTAIFSHTLFAACKCTRQQLPLDSSDIWNVSGQLCKEPWHTCVF